MTHPLLDKLAPRDPKPHNYRTMLFRWLNDLCAMRTGTYYPEYRPAPTLDQRKRDMAEKLRGVIATNRIVRRHHYLPE